MSGPSPVVGTPREAEGHRTRCESHGLRTVTAPEVFLMNEEDETLVRSERPAPDQWPRVGTAAASCPAQAGRFVEE